MKKYRTYKAYTRLGNEIVYGSYSKKSSKENKQDLLDEMKRQYNKYLELKDVTKIIRWNG